MYRRPKFLEVLLEIRQAMSREADYDIDLFAEMIRSGRFKSIESLNFKIETPVAENRQTLSDLEN